MREKFERKREQIQHKTIKRHLTVGYTTPSINVRLVFGLDFINFFFV